MAKLGDSRRCGSNALSGDWISMLLDKVCPHTRPVALLLKCEEASLFMSSNRRFFACLCRLRVMLRCHPFGLIQMRHTLELLYARILLSSNLDLFILMFSCIEIITTSSLVHRTNHG